MNNTNKLARITGFLYLLLAIIAPFSLMYVPSKLIVAGDATATANNILANNLLFRFGMVGETVIFLIEIVIVVLLYVLFKPVNKPLSLAAAFSRSAMAVIQGVNIINSLFALELLTNTAYSTAFGTNQLNTLVSLFIKGHTYGVYIWQIFFGFHLIVLGYLAFKSGFLPKTLGILLMIGSLGYLTDSYGNILLPANVVMATIASILLVFSTIGELSFTLWLLIKGVKQAQLK
ncbi:MAG: DUF4386 domain-containing protein [Clostridia bacterium]|nr:DUF4386 domain-containing protein [Clostridia bacterium]